MEVNINYLNTNCRTNKKNIAHKNTKQRIEFKRRKTPKTVINMQELTEQQQPSPPSHPATCETSQKPRQQANARERCRTYRYKTSAYRYIHSFP